MLRSACGPLLDLLHVTSQAGLLCIVTEISRSNLCSQGATLSFDRMPTVILHTRSPSSSGHVHPRVDFVNKFPADAITAGALIASDGAGRARWHPTSADLKRPADKAALFVGRAASEVPAPRDRGAVRHGGGLRGAGVQRRPPLQTPTHPRHR